MPATLLRLYLLRHTRRHSKAPGHCPTRCPDCVPGAFVHRPTLRKKAKSAQSGTKLGSFRNLGHAAIAAFSPPWDRRVLQHLQSPPHLGPRKRFIQLDQILSRQLDICSRPILFDVLWIARLRDHDDFRLSEQPRNRNLSRRGVPPPCEVSQFPILQQSPLLDRRVGHHRNPTHAAPGQQIVFHAAACQIIKNLIGCNLLIRYFL